MTIQECFGNNSTRVKAFVKLHVLKIYDQATIKIREQAKNIASNEISVNTVANISSFV